MTVPVARALFVACVIGCAVCVHADANAAPAGVPVVIDAFADVSHWSAHPASGVLLNVVADDGAMRLDFDFQKGGGYAVVRRAAPLEVDGNYQFRFRIRGVAPTNTLEFKLIAPGMDDVWWSNRPDFVFPREWQTVVVRKRHVSFAWGPSGGGELHDVAAIELAITAGSGGKGSVWIDDLEFVPLLEPGVLPAPRARATSTLGESRAERALDGDSLSAWRPSQGDVRPRWTVDFGGERTLGGIVLQWGAGLHATDYAIETSLDGEQWQVAHEVRSGDGGSDPVLMTDTDARYVRISVNQMSPSGLALAGFEAKPLEWGATRETFFAALAALAPRGTYPRSYLGEQSYWTAVGLDRDRDEALVDEDGRIEAGKEQFSIEPFIHHEGRLLTWADGETDQGLEGGTLPLPWVLRRTNGLDLTVRTYPIGEPGAGRLIARYTIENTGAATRGTLYLAVRPFQVNPPSQSLNTRGGTARIGSLERQGRAVHVNGVARVVSVTPPDAFGAVSFDGGGIVAAIAHDRLPPAQRADDAFEHASGALAYAFELAPGAARTIDVRLALTDAAAFARGEGLDSVEPACEAAIADWRRHLSGFEVTLPDSEIARTLSAQIGWILVNRNGAAIQPGSRAYGRSWIRDGSLTSTALLRTGHAGAVREFIEWFAPYLYDDGKVPCCVDQRGSDPVPEHDSGGEFIYLVAEYVRHTADLDLAQRMWPQIEKVVGYLDSLRQTRRTREYREPDKAEFFGLLPPSISHEGYSAKPMHSYWDDFFALRGFADAVFLAQQTGRPDAARRIQAIHDGFQDELLASISAAMERHEIDYIPGAADLGDFDATSTTIALSPGGMRDILPRAAVQRTFERYWTFFSERRDGIASWDAMTPYEMRTIGAFVRLGWRDRANALLDWFMTLRRPIGWAHWAEVVDREPRRVRFLGDMPHTWVGSDFVRSVLDMLAYERESDQSIVIGAGVPWEWVAKGDGLRVRNLSTRNGLLGFAMRAEGDTLEVHVEGNMVLPSGGFVIVPPAHRPFHAARVDGRSVPLAEDGSLRVRHAPVRVRFEP